MTGHPTLDRPAGPGGRYATGRHAAGSGGPHRATGVELIGPYDGSGYREPKFLLGRADGQIVQVSDLLYRLAGALDGRRTPAQLAARLGAELGRDVTADQVRTLLRDKLVPAGIADGGPAAGGAPGGGDPGGGDPGGGDPGAGPGPGTPADAARADHLLMLRFRLPVVPPAASQVIAGIFAPLHRRAVVLVALGAFVGLDLLLIDRGAWAAVVPATRGLVDRPASTLAVFGLLFAAGVFHECGHVAACRYGGARPGAMGLGLYLVWPAFYSTVTDSYRLSRAGRLRTDLGGIYFTTVFIAATSGAYLITGEPWLLVAIAVLHGETARQFLPSMRLDGYYILSDLLGLPDLFTFLGPVLRGLVPGRLVPGGPGARDPRVAQLRPAVRVTIVVWVLLVVPVLGFFVVSLLVLAPQVLPELVRTLGRHGADAVQGVRDARVAPVVLAVLQGFLLVLPVFGAVLMLGGALRTLLVPLLGARRSVHRPERVFLLVAIPVALLGCGSVAAADRRITTAGEALTTARAAGTASAGWPEVVAAQQIAALQALLGDLGQATVIDSARSVSVLLGVLGSLLLWPAARRLGLPAPVAALAVAMAGLLPPMVELHGTIDPGAVAAVWLAVAAGLAGRGRGAGAAAKAAAALAVLSAPLVAVGLLAFAAHALVNGQIGARLPRHGARVLGAGFAVGAVAVGVLSTGRGPWVVGGAGPPSLGLLVVVLGSAVVIIGVIRFWVTVLGPIATGVAAVLVCAAFPGPHLTTALLVSVPVLAVLAAALVARELRGRSPHAAGAVLAAALVFGVAGSGTVVRPAVAPDPDRTALTAWMRTQLDPATPVRADPLTAAELLRDGIGPDRLVPPGAPPPPGAVTVDVARPGGRSGPGGGTLLAQLPGGLDGQVAVVRRRGSPDPDRVDPRLSTVLREMAAEHRLTIAGFPVVSGEPAGVPRRVVVISEIDGLPPGTPGITAILTRFLDERAAPLRPATVTVDPRTGMTIGYRPPPPADPSRPRRSS